jgi:glycine/D-amino acid oxidase-like deaminating enzyme
VKFVFKHALERVQKSSDDKITSAEVVCMDSNKTSTIECQNLVIAAGPWTAELFKTLEEDSEYVLENHMRRVPWIGVPLTKFDVGVDGVTKDDHGLILPDAIEKEEVLNKEVVLIPQPARDEPVVIAMATAKPEAEMEVGPADALEPDFISPKAVRHLKSAVVKKFEALEQNPSLENEIVVGTSIVSTGPNERPVIDVASPGLWLCYGFGMHGTSLAPGAASALVRRMFGEASGLDDIKVALPQ